MNSIPEAWFHVPSLGALRQLGPIQNGSRIHQVLSSENWPIPCSQVHRLVKQRCRLLCLKLMTSTEDYMEIMEITRRSPKERRQWQDPRKWTKSHSTGWLSHQELSLKSHWNFILVFWLRLCCNPVWPWACYIAKMILNSWPTCLHLQSTKYGYRHNGTIHFSIFFQPWNFFNGIAITQ